LAGLFLVEDVATAEGPALRLVAVVLLHQTIYLYGFVRPESGQVFWMIVPTVNTELFSLALGEFAKEVGVGKERHILLILDKAGWHTGGEVDLPEGIHLEFLPPGSPELMPAERL
jgi:hypothetical protein